MKHIPRKRFGQNFLTDQSVLHHIIQSIHPQAEERIVEIGPGLGALTRLLLEHVKHLYAVELDRDLAKHLTGIFDETRLTLYSADALQFDFNVIPRASPPLSQPLRVVGNLPYNISTPLLFYLMKYVDQIQDQHFMLQKEVVERMVAEPGSKTFGRLSVMLQWRYHMECLFIVPPTAFDPPPRVESAIVRMIPIEHPLPCDWGKLEHVVAQAFSQRRKVIRNSLSGLFTEQELMDVGIDPQVRPETVSVAHFVALSNRLNVS